MQVLTMPAATAASRAVQVQQSFWALRKISGVVAYVCIMVFHYALLLYWCIAMFLALGLYWYLAKWRQSTSCNASAAAAA
jgi:hypothetical protein